MDSIADIKRKVLLISTLYSSSMIIYSTLPRIIVVAMSFAYLVVIILLLKKQFKTKETLFITSICLLPTSFVSLVATSTSQFPFSWYHIITILLFLMTCMFQRINRVYFIILPRLVVLVRCSHLRFQTQSNKY